MSSNDSRTWVEQRHFVSPGELDKVERWFWDNEYVERFLAAKLEVRAGTAVLDVGAGVGGLSRRLYPLTQPGGSVTALDLRADNVAAALAYAEQMGWNRYRFHQGNALQLLETFGPDIFDVVVEVGMLSNFSGSEAAEAARQMVAVCRPGGKVLFLEIDYLTYFLDASQQHRSLFFEWAGYMVDGRAARGEGSLRSALWLPGLLCDLGLDNPTLRPYSPPERFPPFSDNTLQLVEEFAELFDVNSDVHRSYRPVLLASGVSPERLDQVGETLGAWWRERIETMRRDELPPLLAQVFLIGHGSKH